MLKSIFKVDDPTQMRPARLVEGQDSSLSPVSWSHCFDLGIDIAGEQAASSFRVYTSGNVATADFVWVLLHGAGHGALVWAHMVQELRHCGGGKHVVMAYDSRGHGNSHHSAEEEKNLSRERLASDCVHVVENVPGLKGKPLCLVGHSMGAAIAVEAATRPQLAKLVRALIVMDVVEGTAMASISAIQKFINSRPTEFSSESQAIRWTVDSQLVRSEDSARVSVPSQLVADPENPGTFLWRTNLGASSEYWPGWYDNMSARFLAVPVQKMLMLAGMDRLDTPLMVGQMQGKYQLAILPQCGHQLQEEAPVQVAAKFDAFASRYL